MKVNYIEKGNKSANTVIFLHACGVSSWMWYEQENAFKDYHCIYIDLPQHGESLRSGKFTINNAAESVVEIIKKKANNSKAILIGHETGAKVALDVLKKHKELIGGVVLSSVTLRSQFEAKLHKIIPHKWMIGIFKLKYKVMKYEWYRKIAIEAYGITGENNIKKYLDELVMYSPDQLLDIITESFIKPFYMDKLKGIEVPTLILVGEKELKAVTESAKDLGKLFINSEIFTIRAEIKTTQGNVTISLIAL
ncbi:alpha/beta fold hydrolase [Clostridium beijerinckii]|uniref:alpha/beta fold hydrolase n=1 Tax=Clostridium beijerinckii TaxID=1520 RepID=UPI0015CD99B5|nr:alpha/beta hydrolase [Clostridium beijerinckii]NYC19814.1 pimeloyl-ACP methyl ester carboxylesterase [Clostridium beijerinckii]